MAPAQKIGRALKSAALLPVKGIRASTGRRSTSTSMSPQPGEEPMVILRLQILSCEGLIAKDRGGTSDPFVVCSLLSTRFTTPVSKKTLNPTYASSTATFDFPLYASLSDKLGVLELIVWDKDTFGKDYLGEVGIPLEAWFVDQQDDDEGRGGQNVQRTLDWESSKNDSFTLNLLSTKSHTVATGTITIKLGFVLTPNSQSAFPQGRPGEIEREKYFEEVYANFLRRSRPSLVSAPPTEGVGTIRAHQQRSTHPLFEDDGGLSSSEDEGSESESESGTDSESESESESEYEDAVEGDSEERARRRQLAEEEREREMHERVVNQALGLAVPISTSTSRSTSASSVTSTSTTATTKGDNTPSPMTRSTSGAPSLNTSTSIPPPSLNLDSYKIGEGVKSPTTPTQEASVPTPTVPDGPASAATITGARPMERSLGAMGEQMGTPDKTQREIQGPAAPPTLTASGQPASPPPVVVSTAVSAAEKDKEATQVNVKPSKVQRLSSTFSISKMIPRRLSSKSTATTKSSASSSSVSLVAEPNEMGGVSSSPEEGGNGGISARSKKFGRKVKDREPSDPSSAIESPASASSSAFPSTDDTGEVKSHKHHRHHHHGEGEEGTKKRRKRVGRKIKGGKGGKEYSLGTDNDIVGIVMLEIRSAEDLPKLSNMTRTGWDMDPCVVISFGKKVFRTRVIRHSRNPVWDEKLLFHVRRYEIGFKVHFSILDWDKLSSNDHIGDASFDVKELLDSAPQPDVSTGLYGKEAEEAGEMKDMKMKLKGGTDVKWDAKHSPELSIRAKFQPYAALRQKFWRQYLNQYDTDDTSTLSRLELTSMLDSLGSTLTPETIASFWTRFNKDEERDELSMEEAIMCLETELGRPVSERKMVKPPISRGVSSSTDPEGAEDVLGAGNSVVIGDGSATASEIPTPLVMHGLDAQGREINLEEMDFSGRPRVVREESTDSVPSVLRESYGGMPIKGASRQVGEAKVPPTQNTRTSGNQQTLVDVINEDVDEDGDVKEKKRKKLRFGKKTKAEKEEKKRLKQALHQDSEDSSPSPSPSPSSSSNVDDASGTLDGSSGAPTAPSNVERIINVKNCPMCHRPRMKSKAEMDIITHMAICASQDWGSVDKIMVGNFVTASQAQRKWYTKVLSKVSSGNYKLGANSANIIVQNRATGQLEEEKMQVYVRLGIRLLYKGAKSQMEGARARKLLKSLSIKQGVKYDSPLSAAEIPGFIAFHNLDVNEVLDPLDSFKTFNEFFYRKLKASARPVDEPEDPYRLVSAADCRFMAFESVSSATQIWIKGRDFSVSKLLGPEYKEDWGRYDGGALAIFRLAPQDYHRFHVPVSGTIGKMRYISGEYYTVNPQAIRTALDVYGENARKIVPIDSPQFGRVMAVCVGAMMVGSIETTVDEGQKVNKGDEFGYFAFGGSTIVILFEKGALEWDEDLLINGRASLETLVRVNSGLGRGSPEFRSSVPGLTG